MTINISLYPHNKVIQPHKIEHTINFGKNTLRFYPNNNLSFNILPHIVLYRE